jgi:hypothetical protein
MTGRLNQRKRLAEKISTSPAAVVPGPSTKGPAGLKAVPPGAGGVLDRITSVNFFVRIITLTCGWQAGIK